VPGDSILPTVRGAGFGSSIASRKHVSGSSGSRGMAFSLMSEAKTAFAASPYTLTKRQ
jgi:hypothetical protein